MAENNVVGRFLDAGEEPVETLTPIVGYEMVDLVPLEEAVKPLQPLLHNLDAMVYTAKRNARQPADGLTQDESAAIRLYTIQWPTPYPSLFTLLNQRLRSQDRDTLVDWYLYLKLFLTALYKLPSVHNRIIWRGICGNVNDQYDGDQIWWGTSSCTENMHVMGKFVGLQGVRTLFIIECTNGKAIHAHSQYKFENEILLMPGTYLQVVDKWTPSHDLHIVHLREATPLYQTIASPIGPHSRLPPPTPSSDLTTSDALDNSSSNSQTTAPTLTSAATGSKTTTPKLKRTLIATQLPDYRNLRLEEIIAQNIDNPELKLVFMNLKDQDMEIVAYFALRNNKALRVLNMSSNDIGDKGAQYLSHELQSNTTLTKLSLYNNRIGMNGMQHLSTALTNNKTLTSLNLSSNQLGDEGVQYLCDVLQNRMALTELYLSFNQIGEKGVEYLRNFLKNEAMLMILDLSSNEIGDKGAEYLSDGLKDNQTLCQLDISSNEIGDIGIQHLSDTLGNNRTLQRLNLCNNRFGSKGVECLNKALQNNTKLTVQGLSSN